MKDWLIFFLGLFIGVIWGFNGTHQGKTADQWMSVANKNQEKIASLSAELVETKNLLQIADEVLTLPTPKPTPIIKYIVPPHPDLSTCTLDGDFYYCREDGCYYHPNGTPTGECKIGPPGM